MNGEAMAHWGLPRQEKEFSYFILGSMYSHNPIPKDTKSIFFLLAIKFQNNS